MTLIPDGKLPWTISLTVAFSEQSLDALIADLTESGFHPYLTSVGGSGLGLHRPQPAKDVAAEGGDETFHVSLRMAFRGIPKEQLDSWATAQGKWVFS